MTTYERPPYKVPHKIYLILRVRRRHICLLQIRRHSVVARKFIEEGLEYFHQLLPFGVGIVGDRVGDQVGCELLAGVGVWIHLLSVEIAYERVL